jgi:putative colanic acid biosysnthesis UDP-glucose lipid carrier transferase
MKGVYYSRAVKVMTFIIDFCLINLAFIICSKLGLAQQFSHQQMSSFFLTFGLIWIIAGFFNKIYRMDSTTITRNIRVNLLSTFAIHALIIALILWLTDIYVVDIRFLAYLYLVTVILLIGFRVLYKLITKYFQFTGFDRRKVVILGVTGSGMALAHYFSANQIAGYQFAGFFANESDPPKSVKDKIIGSLDVSVIKDYCLHNDIGEIYFALPVSHQALLKEISKFADDNFIYFRIAPDFSSLHQETGNIFLLNSIPVLTPRKEPLGVSINANLKRAFDIVFSALVIIFIFPFILPLLAIAIRIDSPGPIFFKQLRPGKKNKLFDCYKLRTMRVNNNSELQATKNDRRITRVGRLLRKTSLDELPQFFNVLLGNMSVVGPRPNMISQLDEYSKTINNYKVRHFVTPGITGYAQINGFRGETKEAGLMEKRVQYDVQYIENWSLSLDLKIIFLTVWNMVRGEKNAY